MYNNLGSIAQAQGQWEVAKRWYHKALPTYDRPGLERDAANTYNNLGVVALNQGELKTADEWLRKALALGEHLAMEHEAAGTHTNLGAVAQAQGRLEAAEEWYRKAVDRRLKDIEPLLRAISVVTAGGATNRAEIEVRLADLETNGWHLQDAVRRVPSVFFNRDVSPAGAAKMAALPG